MKTMNIKSFNSNIEITFTDGRETITLYSDNYLSADEKYTAEEERESLAECYELSAEEIEEIIDKLVTLELIER